MKRTTQLLGTVLLVLGFAAAVPVFAQCGTYYGILNPISGGQLEVKGTLDDGSGTGTIFTKFWLQGQGESVNSGTVPTIFQLFPWGQDSYYVWSSWGEVGVHGCPKTSSRLVFLYSIANAGRAQYILMSTGYNDAFQAWDFDAVSNGDGYYGPNTMLPVSIPKPEVSLAKGDTDVMTITVAPPSVNNLRGFFDKDPGTDLVTGVAVRYYQGASAPTSFRTSDWPLAAILPPTTRGGASMPVSLSLPKTAGTSTWIAYSLIFDGGQAGKTFMETEFVGEPAPVVGVTPRAAFATVAAQASKSAITVGWRMSEETGVASYAVTVSRTAAGPYVTLGGPVQPSPVAGTSYKATVTSAIARYVQVVATLQDGSVARSGAVRIGAALSR